MNQYGFAEIEQALSVADSAVSVPEAHGCLCGALCVMPGFSAQHWLRELLPDPAEGTALPDSMPVDETLAQVHRATVEALRGEEMSFSPLLPDDELPLTQRIAALAQWSQGFLYGFGIGAPVVTEALPDDVNEILRDFSQIARATDAETSGGDEEEQAYAELVEYLRAAVQLIHDDLAELRAERKETLPH
jgi:hypothetical protein